MWSGSELNAHFSHMDSNKFSLRDRSAKLKIIRNSAINVACGHLGVKGCGLGIWQKTLENRVPYRSLLMLYTEVKTEQAAGARCHAHCASLPLLPLAQTLANNQEVAHRSERGIFTYPRLDPGLSGSGLLLAPAGSFQWIVLTIKGGRRGVKRKTEGRISGTKHSQNDWWPFLTSMEPGSWLRMLNPSAAHEDNVDVWVWHRLDSLLYPSPYPQ